MSTIQAPPKDKSAGLAFLVSLFVPGAGQMYCGKLARAGVTLAFFVMYAVLTVVGFGAHDSPGPEIFGIGLFGLLVLYIFSFLDAYYAAREINAGIDSLVDANNPRVATTLNLLTNGFGTPVAGPQIPLGGSYSSCARAPELLDICDCDAE